MIPLVLCQFGRSKGGAERELDPVITSIHLENFKKMINSNSSISDTPENLARLFTLYPGIEAGWDFDDPDKCPKTHWYLWSIRGWNTGTDLIKEIGHRRRMDRNAGHWTIYFAHLYLVPGEPNREYDIEQGVPQVEGAVFISLLHWRKQPK